MNVNETKLCECGCGRPAPLARQSSTKHGYIKGQPMRFASGHRLRPKTTIADAISDKFSQGKPEDCWEWQGDIAKTGYGRISLNGTKMLAHRASYIVHFGEIPEGMYVCHLCDNPPCVNPHHLFLGTHQDNMKDMKRKGRSHVGERTGGAKLTEDQVREIVRLSDAGHRRIDVAKQYGVTHSLVSLIARRKIWKHITQEAA